VSQLFDSLRRDGRTQRRTNAPRRAHADAVLATLGYARAKRRHVAAAAIVWVTLALAMLGVSWAGWRLYRTLMAPKNTASHYNPGQLYDQTNEPARAVEHYRTFLDTSGAEHVSRAAAVRARIAALSRTPE
jgi:hypothetical protein